MKSFLLTLSLFICLTLGVSKVWALPNCTGSDTSLWNNCVGTYTDANGSKYVGEYKNGSRHGQGNFTSSEGAKYVGEWKEGNMQGQGILTLQKETSFIKMSGTWKGNDLNGYGRIYKDGELLQEGIFKDGELLYIADKLAMACEALDFDFRKESFGRCVLSLYYGLMEKEREMNLK